MLTLSFHNINTLSQQIYDDYVSSHKEELHHSVCPSCHTEGSLIFHGRYKRTFIDSSGERTPIIIQRCFCKHCGHTHALLPDLLIPFTIFSLYVIISVMFCSDRDSMDASYIYRIKKKYSFLSQGHNRNQFLTSLFNHVLRNRKIFWGFFPKTT